MDALVCVFIHTAQVNGERDACKAERDGTGGQCVGRGAEFCEAVINKTAGTASAQSNNNNNNNAASAAIQRRAAT